MITIPYKNHTIVIETDKFPVNPRTEFDNLSKMVCFHPRYSLGDNDKHDYKKSDFNSWNKLEKEIIKNENPLVILPLYLYDHSGITISTTPFSCRWDSGQIGFIYIPREPAQKEYGVKRFSKKRLEQIRNILLSEVKTYDDYLTGQVYGYTIQDENGKVIDSCSGFYGYESNEDNWDIVQEAKAVVDSLKKPVDNPTPV